MHSMFINQAIFVTVKVLKTRGTEPEWVCSKSFLCGLPWDFICHNGLTHMFPKLSRYLLIWLLNAAVVDHHAIGLIPKRHK